MDDKPHVTFTKLCELLEKLDPKDRQRLLKSLVIFFEVDVD